MERDLQPYVRRLIPYDLRVPARTRQVEPPGPGVVLIFGLGPGLGLVDPTDPEGRPARLGSFLAGPDDARTVLEYEGDVRGVEVDLTPLATRMLFRVPMHELARRTVPLDDLLGRDAERLEERLLEAPGWDERIALVEAALRTRFAEAEPPPPDVAWAWQRLTATRGRIRVSDLAAELHCSRKHLAARFREHVGLPPKLIGRLFRFQNATACLQPSSVDLHLDRDFRDFVGTTPSGFAAAMRAPVTSFQAAPAPAS